MAGVLSGFYFATAAEKQLKQRKHCKKQNLYEVWSGNHAVTTQFDCISLIRTKYCEFLENKKILPNSTLS